MNNAINIIKKIHLQFNKEEITDTEAFRMMKNLPDYLNDVILKEEWASLEEELSVMYPYIGLERTSILETDRQLLGKILGKCMAQENISYAQLSKQVGVSSTLIYNLVEKGSSIGLTHLQKLFYEFGLAISVVDRKTLVQKYYIIQPSEEPSDEDLNNPPNVEEPPVEELPPTDPEEESNPGESEGSIVNEEEKE